MCRFVVVCFVFICVCVLDIFSESEISSMYRFTSIELDDISLQVRHKRVGSERNRSRSTILFVEKSEVSLTVNVSECMNSLIFQIKPRIVVEFNRIRFCMLCAYDIPPPSKSDIVEEKTELDKLIHTLCSRNAFMPNVDVSD